MEPTENLNHTSPQTNEPAQRQGLVVRKSQGIYTVQSNGEPNLCRISSKLRKNLEMTASAHNPGARHVKRVSGIRTVDPVAVGDNVDFVEGLDGHGMIMHVHPRRNYFSRRAGRGRNQEQIIAANIDQVVAVFAAARPTPHWGMLDRYLVEAGLCGVPALIVIAKIDLADDEEVQENLADAVLYEELGYSVLYTSAEDGRGVDDFRDAVVGKRSVLVGKSGVGKTTLLNAVEPGLGLRVGEVRKGREGEGRHTTTHMEMFELAEGGHVIDTPGIKELAIWNPDDIDPARFFPEFEPYLGKCRFGASCSHTQEPGCAIIGAVEADEIEERRWHSYLKIRDEA